VLITTHEHRLDEELLDLATRQPHAYIGLVGSKRKVLRLVERIQAKRGAMALERTYAPVGLDLGAADPAEIAVSIVAEWVALRRGKPAAHLRNLPQPMEQTVAQTVAQPSELCALDEASADDRR
jgi:xanthine dehydrogenase accessory factor